MKHIYLKSSAEGEKPQSVKVGVEDMPVLDPAAAAAKQARMERIKAAMNASARQRRRDLASSQVS